MAESQTPARSVAMDPPHITEFASKRYFEKLNQLNTQPGTAESSSATTPNVSTSTALPLSTFILPLRETKTADAQSKPLEPKKDKSRFFSIRQRVSLRHSKTIVPTVPAAIATIVPETLVAPHPAAAVDPITRAIPFDQLFLALPSELQILIISSLPLTDILNLRLTSKAWHTLITLNEGPIVRYHVENHIPAYALRLYPINNAADYNFHSLCSIWHRLHVAAKLAYLMCDWITKDIFLQQTEAQRRAFAPQHEIMRRRLIPLLFTIFHFFETYRKLHLEHIHNNNGHGLQREPYTLNPIEKKVMDMYDDQTLLRVHEVFPLVISSFCRRLRPPTYVGRVERSLRGYLREKPADEVHVAILCLGGLRQVERLWEIKGYNSRRAAVDVWYGALTKEPITEPQTKARLAGLRGFGRKKSTSGERPMHRSSFSESLHRVRSPSGSMDATNSGYFDPNWVFHTSLSADAPMAPLDSERAHTLLHDLPVLQQIWLTTAEALILERKIVSRTQDIKRNQQVMLDLIRQDGMREEDEWWYGRHNPESVRPPPGAGAAEDDAD
ncbi:Cyclin-like F-box [Cordyceps militaris CM01]|uniref:Cyclin-like F-box n=2 Tax=Cordyceps militaris TaxID=73501 RepID=G3JN38_CORMM|nr:Cyclin-like F-box [Cordyceps militaris CM01]ATY63045.1 Cyclin-like F-box [Cordyceps militaris]EGX90220.1 Cyclin-like F-box [Cordyceps militaris CM01]